MTLNASLSSSPDLTAERKLVTLACHDGIRGAKRRKLDERVKEQARKLPCGSSNFSGKLSLHDSFSIGLIMLSSKEKAGGKKE